MSADILQDAVIALITEKMPAVKTVKAFAGEFTEAEIKATSFAAPAIFVAILGWESNNDGTRQAGRENKRVFVAAFVLTKDVDKVKRARTALLLSQQLEGVLLDWRPDSVALKASVGALDEAARCENLHSSTLDASGLARWLVKWSQPVTFNQATRNPPQLFDLVEIEIIDTVRSKVPDVAPETQSELIVKEQINFAEDN